MPSEANMDFRPQAAADPELIKVLREIRTALTDIERTLRDSRRI